MNKITLITLLKEPRVILTRWHPSIDRNHEVKIVWHFSIKGKKYATIEHIKNPYYKKVLGHQVFNNYYWIAYTDSGEVTVAKTRTGLIERLFLRFGIKRETNDV